MVFHINLLLKFKVQARRNQSWITNYARRQLCPWFLCFYIFSNFNILVPSSNHPVSWNHYFGKKEKGVEAAESGNNSITEENTEENEETDNSTEADDEKMVR